MARIEVVMPQMGESIAEGTIIKWHKKVGEMVKKDETLLEISTDKVDSEIPSPASGRLAEIVVQEQQTVPVRTVIAYLETDADVAAESPARATPAEQPKAGPVQQQAPVAPSAPSVQPHAATGRFYSQLVLSIAREEGISMQELEAIPGSGEGGRVSKKDILAYVAAKKAGTVAAPKPAPAAPAAQPMPKVTPPPSMVHQLRS